MNIKKIKAIYFSPNKATKEIVNKLAKSIGDYEVEEIDLTYLKSRGQEIRFNRDELVVIGFPVYSDRLPVIADGIFEKVQGNNTPAVAVVSYGNRDYGDALLELRNRLEEKNMKVISAAAIIGEHCLNRNVAKGRPDLEDDFKIVGYANKINERIKSIEDVNSLEEIHIKGNYPYRPLKESRTPVGDSKCIQCGLCERSCPVEAIDKTDYRKTDSDLCIFCGRCINVCPTGARNIKDELFLESMKKFEITASERKEIEIFMD